MQLDMQLDEASPIPKAINAAHRLFRLIHEFEELMTQLFEVPAKAVILEHTDDTPPHAWGIQAGNCAVVLEDRESFDSSTHVLVWRQDAELNNEWRYVGGLHAMGDLAQGHIDTIKEAISQLIECRLSICIPTQPIRPWYEIT